MFWILIACIGDAPIKDVPHDTGEPPSYDSEPNQAPVLTLITPQEDQHVLNRFGLSIRVDDDRDPPEQLSVEVLESGLAIQGGFVSSDGTFSALLGPLSNGVHELEVIARDHDALEGTLVFRIEVVESESPMVVFLSPTVGAQFGELEPLSCLATLSDDVSSTLALRWVETSEIDGNSFLLSCPATSVLGNVACETTLDVGLWTLSLEATDDDGHTSMASVQHLNVVAADNWDGDGDGLSPDEGDCDDTNSNIFLGNSEVCDGIDNDCDGSADDGAPGAIYVYWDGDGDGYGDETVAEWQCGIENGYVVNTGDCMDYNPAIYPGAVEVCDRMDQDCDGLFDNNAVDQQNWYLDIDLDGYGGLVDVFGCTGNRGDILQSGDCNDSNSSIFPMATETCDGVDNDCDGNTDGSDAIDALDWYRDVDSDGYGDIAYLLRGCYQPVGYVSDASDCIDTLYFVHPNASETCNLVDDDCNGLVDDNATDEALWYLDADGDGYGTDTTVLSACDQPVGYVPVGDDCNDSDATIHPNAGELCTTMGIDEDCDGLIDEIPAIGDSLWWYDIEGDGFCDATQSSITSCVQPSYMVSNSDDCDDTNTYINPAEDELCDGIDNDCDGAIDDADADLDDTLEVWTDQDQDGYGSTTATSQIKQECSPALGESLSHDDCDDANPSVSPSMSDTCNAIDDNCNGDINDAGVDAYEANNSTSTACGVSNGFSGCSAVSTATYVHNATVNNIYMETSADVDWFEWYVDDGNVPAQQAVVITSTFRVLYEILYYNTTTSQWVSVTSGGGTQITIPSTMLNSATGGQEWWRLKLFVYSQYAVTNCNTPISFTITEPS